MFSAYSSSDQKYKNYFFEGCMGQVKIKLNKVTIYLKYLFLILNLFRSKFINRELLKIVIFIY